MWREEGSVFGTVIRWHGGIDVTPSAERREPKKVRDLSIDFLT
jgi:hypothetical protein